MLRSTLSGNTAGVGGGLALNEFSGYPEGSLLIQESTVSANTATFAASGGGGVFVNVGDAGVNATFRNSTITDNTSANLGGGIMAMQTSSVTMEHVTLVDNSGANGANVFVAARDLTSTASVIADPAGGGDNCDIGAPGVFVSGGGNVIDDASCPTGPDDTFIFAPTGLAVLNPNGGPTPTRLPNATSPVLDAVPSTVCLPIDQRSEPRPVAGPCDAGAVEIEGLNMIMGTDGDDRLVGTPGDDLIIAGPGNDRIRGGGGNDVIIGGPGRDLIDGGAGDDEIEGGEGNDLLFGRRGDDIISGGPGRDLLVGGRGTNTLDGGPGRDLCLPGKGRPYRC
ncbi:MAG: calcium-binding protein [Actinomycetota bacterium]